MAFAALPIVIYAVFDREYTEETLLKHPHFYVDGPNNRYFFSGKYWTWFFVAFLNGLIALLITFTTMNSDSLNNEGWLSFFWLNGNIVLEVVVIIANLKILIFSNQFSILLVGSIIGSILCFYLGFFIFNLFLSSQLYGTFQM